MAEENKAGYYAIIPANVRYDSELTDKAKLLYGEITCLSNKEGYCFATNKYFAKLYNCTNRAIQNAISKLQERRYINIVIEDNYQRKIYIASSMGYEKNFIGGNETKFTRGYEKNFTNNIINNNMIDRLFLYIRNEDEKIPKEFARVNKMKIIELLYKYEMLYTDEMLQYMQGENLQKIKDITYTLALIVKENLEHSVCKITREKLIQIYNECKTRELEYKGTENEIEGFVNYYYRSIKNELVKDNSQSFFIPKNGQETNNIIEDDEEEEEL